MDVNRTTGAILASFVEALGQGKNYGAASQAAYEAAGKDFPGPVCDKLDLVLHKVHQAYRDGVRALSACQ